METNKSDATHIYGEGYKGTSGASEDILDGDKVFFLSSEEACSSSYGFTNDLSRIEDDIWRLRSPKEGEPLYAGIINSYGQVDYNSAELDFPVRPALNLDSGAVLFASAASNGKAASGMDGALTQVAGYTGNEWKLTLYDSGRDGFSIGTVSAYDGKVLKVAYSGAVSGENEYISAVIKNAAGEITYYGRLQNASSANGTVEVTLPDEFNVNSDKLYIFNEQYNGDYETDYAGALLPVSMEKDSYSITYDLKNISSSNTATFRLIGDNETYETYFSVSGTYSMPESVVVKADGAELEPLYDYFYDHDNGQLKIFADRIYGDIEIIAAGAENKMDTPEAVFEATGYDCGKLLNVEDGMQYSVDGGITWNSVKAFLREMEIAGVTAENDIRIKRIGDGAAIADSDIQTIDVTQAASPADISAVDCTTDTQSNGQITGLNGRSIEYKAANDTSWSYHFGDDNAITKLPAGTYDVRVRASGPMLASETVTVTIGRHTCIATEGWQYNELFHWNSCINPDCTGWVNRSGHSGGTATCTDKAVCQVCKGEYGQLDPDNHTGNEEWIQTEKGHTKVYSCCKEIVEAESGHTWKNGVCSVCGYECKHSGGEATCVNKAVCEICGLEYGAINAFNHTELVKTEEKPAAHMSEGNIQYWYCSDCGKYFSDEAGEDEIQLSDTVIPKLDGHTPDGTGWYSDEKSHWNTCECGEILNKADHVFEWKTDKEATETEVGSKHEECTVCGYMKEAVEIPKTGNLEEQDPAKQPEDKPSDKDSGNSDVIVSSETGDKNDTDLWISIIVLAAAAIAGASIFIYNKKR